MIGWKGKDYKCSQCKIAVVDVSHHLVTKVARVLHFLYRGFIFLATAEHKCPTTFICNSSFRNFSDLEQAFDLSNLLSAAHNSINQRQQGKARSRKWIISNDLTQTDGQFVLEAQLLKNKCQSNHMFVIWSYLWCCFFSLPFQI